MLAFAMLVGSACSQPADEAVAPAAPNAANTACAVATPASWQSLIGRSTAALPAGARVIPFATGTTPATFFAELYSATWSGVVSVTSPGGAVSRIKPFANPRTDQTYAGSFDGRWLVFVVQRSPEDSNDWEIWAWDRIGPTSFQIAQAPRAGGGTISGPIIEPVVVDGMAAWVQAGSDGVGEVHLYSLTERKDRVVARHATSPITFIGHDLLWMHLDVAGQSGHFEMTDISGRPVAVPAPLASVKHAAYVAAADGVIAWTDGSSLWVSQGGGPATAVYRVRDGDYMQFLGIAGGLVTWDGAGGPSALDLRSTSVTPLTPADGGRFASGRSLLVYWPGADSSKSAGGTMVVSDVDASRLPPLPRCA